MLPPASHNRFDFRWATARASSRRVKREPSKQGRRGLGRRASLARAAVFLLAVLACARRLPTRRPALGSGCRLWRAQVPSEAPPSKGGVVSSSARPRAPAPAVEARARGGDACRREGIRRAPCPPAERSAGFRREQPEFAAARAALALVCGGVGGMPAPVDSATDSKPGGAATSGHHELSARPRRRPLSRALVSDCDPRLEGRSDLPYFPQSCISVLK